MEDRHKNSSATKRWMWVLAALINVVILSVQEFHASSAETLITATYNNGILNFNIPLYPSFMGEGKLTVEVLDPEDNVLARTESQVKAEKGAGLWHAKVKLDPAVAPDEVVWDRVHYRFAYRDTTTKSVEGTASISQILLTPVVHILSQQSYLAGNAAAVRVIVSDSHNHVIAGRGSVHIELLMPDKKSITLYVGNLNRRGTVEARFRFPTAAVGSYPMHYVVDTSIGSTEFTQRVQLEDKVSILLTTEKPIYQPGQTIHVRALALDRSDNRAVSGRKLTFEVEDSKGNKVFRKVTRTDAFGIASAEFEIADEVNLGTYHLGALLSQEAAGDASAEETELHANTATVALNVERYVLPKFKVSIDFASKNEQTKNGYRPGDHLSGTVHANYFFGKPVDGAEVSVKGSAMDASMVSVASVYGKTDRDGSYRFDLQLPSCFVGRPLSGGAARVLIEAEVKDSAGHSERRGEPITVSESPILITAVPEAGTLVPNLSNQVFILTAYPDGTPAKTKLRINVEGTQEQQAVSDDGGVAVVTITPRAGANSTNIEAEDAEGNHASTVAQLDSRQGEDQILLRTDHAVYRAGEQIHLKVFSTKKQGTAYVDIVKEGQTVLTRDLNIENGEANLSLPATPDLAGTVDFNAYLFGGNAISTADHRLIFVQPADELKIEASADAAVYKPGGEACIRFRVTNSHGEGVHAALGLQIVDEAVFALAEKQPGFAKVFFYLEQDAMKPGYEIHSIGMSEIVETSPSSQTAQRDRAARALFSATEIVSTNQLQAKFGDSVPMTRYSQYYARYQASFLAQVRRLAEGFSRAYGRGSETADLAKDFAKEQGDGNPDVRDAWGTLLRIAPAQEYPDHNHYFVTSAGPDQQFNTSDDMTAYMEIRGREVVGSGDIDFKIEHNRGAFKGFAEIEGTVTDMSGARVPGADIKLHELSMVRVRHARADAAGQFVFAAVRTGRYEVQVSSAGFRGASQDLILRRRDKAVLAATLSGGPDREIDEIASASVSVQMAMPAGMAGGIGSGRGGGIGGGTFHVGGGMPQARVRSYFPEALYVNPEIITNKNGTASILIPLADSITTWRMAMIASSAHGSLGSGTSSLKVLQNFFVDLDLPVTLTQGDQVSIPVAAYNYSGARGQVNLNLQPDDWYSLVGDTSDKSIAVDAGRVGGTQFTIQAKRIGKFKLKLSARMRGTADQADIVMRDIEVIPNGREQSVVFNGRLENVVKHELNFPATSIPEASKIFVRLYPGPLSQVIEGMDSILRMPGGCFEQTSSSTYPNVLALAYMKRTKKLTPEVHAKAEGYIANGYQRLLTFEVPGGGFSWFGQAPANKILTAYGLMEFSDMSKVYDIDPRIIERTQRWLEDQQQPDGSWKPDTSFINEAATNRYNSDVTRITAYVGWALETTGYRGVAVEKAKQLVEAHLSDKNDAYTLAVIANFATDFATGSAGHGRDRSFLGHAMKLLLDARTERDGQVWWTADETAVYSTGESASIETSALAAQALLKWGKESNTTRKVMNYITSKKDAAGTWGTTQATIMALRALLLATEKSADVRGVLQVFLSGKPVGKLMLTPKTNGVLHQFVFKENEFSSTPSAGRHIVELRFDGKGGMAYQIVGSYFLPWDKKPANEPLSIEVAYDKTRLAQDDIATATATIKNNLSKSANMVIVDLGIPPGFDLLSEDLQAYLEKSAGKKSGRLGKFSLTATQAILYFDSIAPGDTVALHFRFRAKYAVRARTFHSRVYEYYDPDVSSIARPVQFEVQR